MLETIRDLGLELQVIFNKGAVMVLPGGMNKATGLKAALKELNISLHNTVGVGDAENDHAFLSICECSAAVANALPAVKDTADMVLKSDHGAGVSELIREILADDLARRAGALRRHEILLGKDAGWRPSSRCLRYGVSALVVGTSGGGKSTLTTGLIERLNAKHYGFCVIDPEGDYDVLEDAAVLGSPDRAPSVDECMQLLAKPGQNAVINLVGLEFSDRPAFFMTLFARIRDLRAKTGHPHWLIVDEVHHVLPADWKPAELNLPAGARRRSHDQRGSRAPCRRRRWGWSRRSSSLAKNRRRCCASSRQANGTPAPASPLDKLPKGEALIWHKATAEPPRHFVVEPSKTDRRRHVRKYAEGALPEDRSFYFRGPEKKLNLRAPNLIVFTDLADGVDADTWLYHWQRGEVSAGLHVASRTRNSPSKCRRSRSRFPTTRMPPARRCGSSSSANILCPPKRPPPREAIPASRSFRLTFPKGRAG